MSGIHVRGNGSATWRRIYWRGETKRNLRQPMKLRRLLIFPSTLRILPSRLRIFPSRLLIFPSTLRILPSRLVISPSKLKHPIYLGGSRGPGSGEMPGPTDHESVMKICLVDLGDRDEQDPIDLGREAT